MSKRICKIHLLTLATQVQVLPGKEHKPKWERTETNAVVSIKMTFIYYKRKKSIRMRKIPKKYLLDPLC